MAAKKKISIGIVGLWHLGCVLSASWSKKGFKVTGLDLDKDLIANLKKGIAPIYEPNLNETLKKNIRKGSLHFTDDYRAVRNSEFVFLAYDTPVTDDDGSDLLPLERAIKNLSLVLQDHAIVIVSSQTPVGTCEKFRKFLKTHNETLDLVYSPENLRLGEAIQNYLHPPRIILGTEEDPTRKRVLQLFSKISAPVLTMNLASAEMVKHGINSFLAASITFSNQIADVCENSGADVNDVIRGMKSDPRIGPKAYLAPGIGFSGGTLGRDLKVLGSINGSQARHTGLFQNIMDLNARRKMSILDKMESLASGGLISKRIGILGLTYKPGTSTLRRSLPAEIVNLLIQNKAQVSVFDPKADLREWSGEKTFRQSRSAEEVIQNSEMIALLTEWPEFLDVPWKKLLNRENPQIIFDAKNFLLPLRLDQIGYRYSRIGTHRNT